MMIRLGQGCSTYSCNTQRVEYPEHLHHLEDKLDLHETYQPYNHLQRQLLSESFTIILENHTQTRLVTLPADK